MLWQQPGAVENNKSKKINIVAKCRILTQEGKAKQWRRKSQINFNKRDKPETPILSHLKAAGPNGRLCGGKARFLSSSPSGVREMGPPGERKLWERRRPRGRGRKGERGEGRERVKPHRRRGSKFAAAAITFRPSLSFLPSGFTTPINVVCGTPYSCARGRSSTHSPRP